jgi:flagellar P-ring protein FlgI
VIHWDSVERRPGDPVVVKHALQRAVMFIAVALIAVLVTIGSLQGQQTRISDLTVQNGDIPYRLVGYGLVVGLDGSGDRVIGGFSAGHTVRSIANLLRRFGVEVPENMLRTRNVAAVLVTAETSPYLRPGARFDVHVASVGDARSLRGGVLWTTPLQADPTSDPVGSAQGAILVAEAQLSSGYSVETAAVMPEAGLLEALLPPPDFASSGMLFLNDPNIATAVRIAQAINTAVGDGTAAVDDPGSVTLTLDQTDATARALQLAEIGALAVLPDRAAEVVIDSRAGTVIAGGGITIGEAVVSHGAMTLSIGDATTVDAGIPGDLRIPTGASVQDVAAALHGVAAPPQAIAAVFEALRQVGALTARVTVR